MFGNREVWFGYNEAIAGAGLVQRSRRGVTRRLRHARFEALRFTNRRVYDLVRRVRAEQLTYLEPSALAELAACVTAAERAGRPGVLIEAGCAYGGSAIVLAAVKRPDRPLRVFDVFGAFPEPTAADGAAAHERYDEIASGRATWAGGRPFYSYVPDLVDVVRDSFERHGLDPATYNVELVRGLFEDTLHVVEPVAFAHIDGDWYESVRTCLERIAPHLVRGGVLVIDDYDDWAGCRKAVDEFFANKRDDFDFERRSRLHIVRR